MENSLCCCGSTKSFKICCAPFLSGAAAADTPETLMRSRYAAFVHKNADYLIATMDPARRSPDDRASLEQSFETTRWLGLVVLKTELVSADAGRVEYVAFYEARQGAPSGQDHEQVHEQLNEQLHERSDFIRRDNVWFYNGGEILPPVKWGRNQACWCGSGKKFKKCHGRRA